MSPIDILINLVLFLVVQGLVYLILTNSSNIFSKNKNLKSFSFKRARSSSVRNLLSLISDVPSVSTPRVVGVPSPTATVKDEDQYLS
ncbi:Phosphoheptose isomerase [Bienertia sinuspersici]